MTKFDMTKIVIYANNTIKRASQAKKNENEGSCSLS